MKRCLLPLLLLASSGLCWGQGQPEFPASFRYAEGRLVSGHWSYDFSVSGGCELDPAGVITGFAFGPGRSEIAYSTAPDSGNPSRLWTVAFSAEEIWKPGAKRTHLPPRLLWEAPEGIVLRGPIWWRADGSGILVRSFREGKGDVVAVDYTSGPAQWMTEGDHIVGAVARPVGNAIAYVTEGPAGRRSVFLSAATDSGARRVGDGGINLRWSPDGRSLTWLDPRSDGAWARMVWEVGEEAAREGGFVPPRGPEAIWSPDGELCAEVRRADGEMELLICSAASASGEALQFPELGFQRLLGWTPDSNLIVALGDMNMPFLVSAHAPVLDVRRLNEEAAERCDPAYPAPRRYAERRALLLPAPISLEAGPPSWSSSGYLVAVVLANRLDPRHPYAQFPEYGGEDAFPAGKLAIVPYRREFVAVDPPVVEEVASNMQKIALALQMYLADHDDTFPAVRDIADLMGALAEYAVSDSAFRYPKTGEIIVKSQLPPIPLSMTQIEDPTAIEVAIVDSIPGVTVIAYADGHVEVRR